MNISVVVPTLRRPDDLIRCLNALDRQLLPANEVVVIVREDDTVTRERLDAWQMHHALAGLCIVLTNEPGVVAAYNLGKQHSTGDIVCYTDDDAAPHPDWIARISEGFAADSSIGGIGGKDIIYQRGQAITGNKRAVGLISWYGRMSGNHHVGSGPVREIHVLKGVNMCWRRVAIEGIDFDSRLRGSGAQVHCELAFSYAVRQRGWRLIYDPNLLVDHYHAQRFDEDQRNRFNELAFFNATYNFGLVMFESLPPLQRWVYLQYIRLIGNRDSPGIIRAFKLAIEGDGWQRAWQKRTVSLRATLAARMSASALRNAAPPPQASS